MITSRTGLPLPHAYPFLLLDRIDAVHPGEGAEATKQVTADDPVVDDAGTLSSVFCVEAMAQCAGLAVAGIQQTLAAMLVGVDRFRSRGRIRIGDTVRVKVRIVKIFGRTVKARGTLQVGRRVCAAAELVLQLGAPPDTVP